MIGQGWVYVFALAGLFVGWTFGRFTGRRAEVVELRRCDVCSSREAKVCYRCR